MARRAFKFKPAKVTHDQLAAELTANGLDASLIFACADNEASEYTVDEAANEIAHARQCILARQDAVQFDAYLETLR